MTVICESALLVAHGPNDVKVACTGYVPATLSGAKTVARPLFTSTVSVNEPMERVTRPFGDVPFVAVTRTSKETTPVAAGFARGVTLTDVFTIGASSTIPS